MQMNDDILLGEDELYVDDDFFNDEEDLALDLLAIDGEQSAEETFDEQIRDFEKFTGVRPMQNGLFSPQLVFKK